MSETANRLHDFSTNRRVVVLSALALPIGIVSAFSASMRRRT